ncbi:MAG: aminodeoxychorismate lyase [Gammaproteobacteria bacterium]|nr:aminodeoxychorismate lyase [Gammaproteobacteria bacterium]
MTLINGIETDHLPINDRGLQYGDGLFETIEISDGRPVFLDRHLQRLVKGCIALAIPTPDSAILIEEIQRVCRESPQAVLKIIITRGNGGRGYRLPQAVNPTRIISLHPFPEYPADYAEHGINARFCETRLGLNPALAGLKHLNRLEQVLARSEWNNDSCQEGIMQDANGYVIEGTMTNLFYLKNDHLYTSSLQLCGIAGIIRDIVMHLATSRQMPLIEHDYDKAELLSADSVFVCNSVIGIWPIKQLEGVQFAVSQTIKELQRALTDFKTSGQ